VLKLNTQYDKTAWDMDGVFLDDVDRSLYINDLENALKIRDGKPKASYAPASIHFNDVIITGRPIMDEERTLIWAKNNGIVNSIILRDDNIEFPTSLTIATWKGTQAVKLGFTHFVESSAEQSIYLANTYSELKVIWWNNGNPIYIQASEK
jgi:hypothetical protein